MQDTKQIKTQIVFSLRIHTALQLAGYQYIQIMPNPKMPKYNCQIYEATPAFMEDFNRLTGGHNNG